MLFSFGSNKNIAESAKMGKSELLSRFHWLVVGISLVATVSAWQISLRALEERTEFHFNRQAELAVDIFEEHLNRYADLLNAGVSLFTSSYSVHSKEWLNFTSQMKLVEKYPAISSFGIAPRVDRSDMAKFLQNQRDLHPGYSIRSNSLTPRQGPTSPYSLPITHIAPSWLARSSPGLDLTSETRRLDAIKLAAKTGNVQLTAPIRPTRSDPAGFIMIAPAYNTYVNVKEGNRQEIFSGIVFASVITRHLAQGLLENSILQVAIRVSDKSEVLYNELLKTDANIDPNPLLSTSRTVPLYGRDWRFDIHSTHAFRQSHKSHEPILVLLGGLTIDTMLLLLFFLMSHSNRRAIEYGDDISKKYQAQAVELRKSKVALEKRNDELKSFSYIVSHDLKSPLIRIDVLSKCVEQDMSVYLPQDVQASDITKTLSHIRNQVKQSQSLIKGILEYSGLTNEIEAPVLVDVRQMAENIRQQLLVEENQLKLEGDFPALKTSQTQLLQVLTNLIGNGYKYHNGQNGETAVVTLTVENSLKNGFVHISVADNGPGIEPKYHKYIFDVFSTLQPKDHSVSSGVGLAIVKKLVQRHGGEIVVNSQLGNGSVFSFDWSNDIVDNVNEDDTLSLPKAA